MASEFNIIRSGVVIVMLIKYVLHIMHVLCVILLSLMPLSATIAISSIELRQVPVCRLRLLVKTTVCGKSDPKQRSTGVHGH